MNMKRFTFITIIIALAAATAYANDNPDKKDRQFTPETGDFGITISANPITSFIGNLFNNSTSNSLTDLGGEPYNPGLTTLQPAVSFAGKYFLKDNLAVRVNFGWILHHDKNNVYAPDDAALLEDPLSNANVIDSRITNNSGGSFMAGIEYRVGKGRIQGVFGGGLLYAFSTYRVKYSYGNAITDINREPSTGLDNVTAPSAPGFSYQRYLRQFTDAPTHYFGLVGFAGIEWFVAPKVSLGAEVNLVAAVNWTKGLYYTAEGYNALSEKVEEWTELQTPTSSGFDFGTENIGANLSVNFYF